MGVVQFYQWRHECWCSSTSGATDVDAFLQVAPRMCDAVLPVAPRMCGAVLQVESRMLILPVALWKDCDLALPVVPRVDVVLFYQWRRG